MNQAFKESLKHAIIHNKPLPPLPNELSLLKQQNQLQSENTILNRLSKSLTTNSFLLNSDLDQNQILDLDNDSDTEQEIETRGKRSQTLPLRGSSLDASPTLSHSTLPLLTARSRSHTQPPVEMVNTTANDIPADLAIFLAFLSTNPITSLAAHYSDTAALSSLLHSHYQHLSKSKHWPIICQYLSSPGHYQQKAFEAYLNGLGFEHMSFMSALRLFGSRFIIGGEAQQVDRCMSVFGKVYYERNPNHPWFKNAEMVYSVAFGAMVLNTDLHNPRNRIKMKKEEFIQICKELLSTDATKNDAKENHENAKSNDALNQSEEKLSHEAYLIQLYEDIEACPLTTLSLNLNPSAHLSTFRHPLKQGFLYKQGGRIKTWKRRYFLLVHHCLYYFKKKVETFGVSVNEESVCGVIPLERVRVEEVGGKRFRLVREELEGEKVKGVKQSKSGQFV